MVHQTDQFYGKTKAEVKRKLDAFKKERSQHGYVNVQKTTVKDYMDNWLYNSEQGKLKPSTFDRKEETVIYQVYPYIGSLQIYTLMPSDVERMIASLVKEEYSYYTIKKVCEAVNSCFKTALIRREVMYNPALGVSLPKNTAKDISDIEFYEEDQAEAICTESIRKHGNGASVYRLGYAIVLLLNTGLRIGELLALTWEDVNLNSRTLLIKANSIIVKNRNPKDETDRKYITIIQDSTKTKSGTRVVPLNKKAYDAMVEIQKITGNCKYVMSTETGKQVSGRNVDRMFRNILTQCELPIFGVHSLRHTFATLMFAKGGKDVIQEISEILGHSDTLITSKIYVHLILKQKANVVALLDEPESVIECDDYTI